MICDNDSIHHARAVTAYLKEQARLSFSTAPGYSPHDYPVERIWAALKNYVPHTAVSWPGRLRQIRSFSVTADAGLALGESVGGLGFGVVFSG